LIYSSFFERSPPFGPVISGVGVAFPRASKERKTNMPESPKTTIDRIQTVLNAWQTLRPAKSFAGMPLEQFKEKVKPSFDTRTSISAFESQLLAAKDQREQADRVSLAAVQLVVHAIKGDPDEGENGEVYGALGYIRKSERRSGLHRSKRPPLPAVPAAASS